MNSDDRIRARGQLLFNYESLVGPGSNALRESEERYRALVEASSAAIVWTCPPSGIQVSPQPSWMAYTGQTSDEAANWGWLDALHPDDSAHASYTWKQSLATGSVYDGESRIRRHDGIYRWMRVRAVPCTDEDGRVVEWVGMCTDVTELHEAAADRDRLPASSAIDLTERWRAADANTRDRELLTRLFERLPVMIARYDPKLRGFQFNDEFRRVLGWTEQDAVEKDLLTLAYPAADVREDVAQFMAAATGAWREFTVTAKDGTPVPSAWANLRLSDDTQVGIGLDLRERKLAEHALKASEDNLRAVIDNLPSGLIVADVETRALQWNRHALRIHSYAEGENEHRNFETLVVDRDVRDLSGKPVPIEQWPLARVLRGETFQGLEFVVRDLRKGWERVFNYSGVVIAAAGRRLGLLAIEDVTARARAERAMGQSQQLLRSTMDNFPTVIAFKDREGRFVDVNRAVEGVLGLPKEQIIGRTLHDFVPKEAADRLMANEVAVMASRRAEQVNAITPLESGTLHHLNTCFPLIDPDGAVYGTGHISLDVTELKRIEDELREANQQLREADQRKTEFVATLAHELRNPLAPIRNALQILGTGNDTAVAGEARAMMSRQLNQLVRLVDDLLDMSRITTGKLRLNRERLEVRRIVEQAIENSIPLIDARRHRLVVEPAARDVRVLGDAVRLAQILTNLLNNAAKYTEPGGTIAISVEVAGQRRVCLRISDTGIGIEADALPRVFDLFAQVEAGADKAHGGLGIGLSLARRLAEMHGGTLQAESAGRGQGAAFTLDLPIADELIQPSDDAGADKNRSKGRCKVVVVDDNRDSADSLAIVLKMNGHEVATAYDGQAGVDAIRRHRPQAAIVDLGMPGFDGFRVAREIREEPWGAEMVLIALTGWGQEEDKRRTLAAGFDKHLTKPIEPERIESVLERIAGCAKD